MVRRSFVPFLLLALGACSSPSSPTNGAATPGSPSPGGFAATDVCAGDSWLPQLLGERPTITNTMWLEPMRRALGPNASLDHLDMDYVYELGSVRNTSIEMYEWRSGQPNSEKSLLTVLRQAFGDPRQLREDNTYLYGNPISLANGVLEYPPSREAATQELPFRPRGGRALYTFPDGTWVRIDAWMMQRVRGAFASGPPPLPAPRPDVAWEICGTLASLANVESAGVWGVRPERGVLRFLAGREPAGAEMVFRFSSPALAIRAEGEQRVRCSQPQAPRQDKGLFSLVPPCTGILTSTTSGPLLHYTFRATAR
jgi:hypothetical protein